MVELSDRGHAAGRDLASPEAAEAFSHLAFVLGDADPDGRVARRLLAEFGSVTAAIQATALRRNRVLGDEASSRLNAFGAAMRATLAEQLRCGPVLPNSTVLRDYLACDLAARPSERFRVLFLNGRNHLLADELVSEGTIDETAVYVREIVRRALELGAASLILVHNHPSGDATPSKEDVRITRAIGDAARCFGIAIHDHLILVPQQVRSLRGDGHF